MSSIILADFDRSCGHIVYNKLLNTVSLYDGDPAAGTPRGSLHAPMQDFLKLRASRWITEYESLDGERRFKITEGGVIAARGAITV